MNFFRNFLKKLRDRKVDTNGALDKLSLSRSAMAKNRNNNNPSQML
jgi:hypothetical protein